MKNTTQLELQTESATTANTSQPTPPGRLVSILPPQDAVTTLKSLRTHVNVVMLDPWYNKGVGGEQEDYDNWLGEIVSLAAARADHVFVWGFPEIVSRVLNQLPPQLSLVSWLTWYYKNCPSVIRGWRSAQNACLHLSRKDAPIYPEHFLNDAQVEKRKQGKLRYMPGPASVIEVPLNIGFVGRKEQTGHPSQKPEKVFETLYLMTTKPGDVVVDPFAGSGTTGAVANALGLRAFLCDSSEEYTVIAEKRLGIKRAQPSPKYFRRKL